MGCGRYDEGGQARPPHDRDADTARVPEFPIVSRTPDCEASTRWLAHRSGVLCTTGGAGLPFRLPRDGLTLRITGRHPPLNEGKERNLAQSLKQATKSELPAGVAPRSCALLNVICPSASDLLPVIDSIRSGIARFLLPVIVSSPRYFASFQKSYSDNFTFYYGKFSLFLPRLFLV